MKRLIGILIMVSFIVAVGTAYAAELNIGTRYYTKFLNRNTFDATKYVTTGNGVGARGELELTLDGKVSDRCEMGGRILTVWDPSTMIAPSYSDWGGWYSDQANLWQVRGMWLKFYPATIPTLKSVLFGSTDIGMFSPWTVGKIRWIDRDNARIIYGEGQIGPVKYGLGTTPMPAWWGVGWSTGPNPRSVWTTAGNLAFSPNQAINLRLNASHNLAIEQDPALPIVEQNGKTRYDNSVEILEVGFQPNPVYSINGLVGISNYSADQALIGAAQGWWPHIPYANCTGNAMKLTAAADDPLGIGLTLKGEYFNVSPDFVSIVASRRETNVLLSEGYVRYGAGTNGSTWRGDVGFTPSVFADNGITDWNEANYQSIAGWNGLTFIPEYRRGPLGVKAEFSVMTNGLNSQSVDVAKYFWSAAQVDQSSSLMALRVDYLLPNGLGLFGKYKTYGFSDGVNTSITTDNVTQSDAEMYAGATYQLTDEIGLTGGFKTLAYVNKLDQTKTYDFSGGMMFAEAKVNVGGADIGLAYEKVDGEDKVASAKVSDMRFKGTVEVKI